jgi:hypothetical protein
MTLESQRERELRARFATVVLNACDRIWNSCIQLNLPFKSALGRAQSFLMEAALKAEKPIEYSEEIKKACEILKSQGDTNTILLDKQTFESLFLNNSPENKAKLVEVFTERLSGEFTFAEFYEALNKLRSEFEEEVK